MGMFGNRSIQNFRGGFGSAGKGLHTRRRLARLRLVENQSIPVPKSLLLKQGVAKSGYRFEKGYFMAVLRLERMWE